MIRDDFDEFAQIWGACWEMYGKAVSVGALEMAFNALAPHDIAAIRRALTRHVRDAGAGKFPPNPADVVTQIDGTDSDRCHVAWAKLRRAIKRVGPYRSVAFDDPIIHCAVRDLGGWAEVNDWRTDDMPFNQQRFDKAYRAYGHRDPVVHPPYLRGAAEQHNAQHGLAVAPPVVIGDAAAAQHVIASGGDDGLIRMPDHLPEVLGGVSRRLASGRGVGAVST